MHEKVPRKLRPNMLEGVTIPTRSTTTLLEAYVIDKVSTLYALSSFVSTKQGFDFVDSIERAFSKELQNKE